MLRSDGNDSYVARLSNSGSEVQCARIGNFSGFDEFSVGPAGLATTAIPSERGVSDDSGMPVGRVAKDGSAWGWQTVQEAFGLDDVDAQAIVAVGGDFVVASVQVFEPLRTNDLREGDSGSSGALVQSAVTRGPRWFIARVP